MDKTAIVMIFLLIGSLAIIVSVISLIHDSRKHRYETRERRRKNLSDSTAKTILAYASKQHSEAMYYRKRA